jgi:hypothetical protein
MPFSDPDCAKTDGITGKTKIPASSILTRVAQQEAGVAAGAVLITRQAPPTHLPAAVGSPPGVKLGVLNLRAVSSLSAWVI